MLNTILSSLWRALCCIFDWKANLRSLVGRGRIDVCFITNMRDEVDRKNFLGVWRPKSGHFNGPRYYYRGVIGRTRALDVTAKDLTTEVGRQRAQTLFIKACKWAEKKGAKAILLAAGTKRLFKADELRVLFPNLIFTIGDNGTMLIFVKEALQTLERSGLKPGLDKVAVLGPYGFLGEEMLKILLAQGYCVTGIGPSISKLVRIRDLHSIPTANSLDTGEYDAIVACTHSEKVLLTASNVDSLRKDGKKLLVIDVAEPSNMRRGEFKKVADRVIRIDSGNAYSPKLKYVLGRISYNLFRLSDGVVFGCFAETMAIGQALKANRDLSRIDWFTVSEENMNFVETLFDAKNGGFTVPTSRNYGKSVESFNLNLAPLQKTVPKFIGQKVWHKIANGLASWIL